MAMTILTYATSSFILGQDLSCIVHDCPFVHHDFSLHHHDLVWSVTVLPWAENSFLFLEPKDSDFHWAVNVPLQSPFEARLPLSQDNLRWFTLLSLSESGATELVSFQGQSQAAVEHWV